MKRSTSLVLLASLAAATFVAAPAEATVEGYIMYNIPFLQRQTDDICIMRLPLLSSFGIPAAVMAQASLTPTAILQDFPTKHYVNVNLAAPTTLMVHTYVSDSVTSTGVYEYAMKLDVTKLSSANGTTITGRKATIQAAKLALISIARNMAEISNGQFRLKVTFVGLPSQTSLPGTVLNATTSSPYSSASALLAAYQKELLNKYNSCPDFD